MARLRVFGWAIAKVADLRIDRGSIPNRSPRIKAPKLKQFPKANLRRILKIITANTMRIRIKAGMMDIKLMGI
jgi:hypothetical protein